MKIPTPQDLQRARPPIASLISKSLKAKQKLSPKTWQYKMLRNNLKALRIASTLLNNPAKSHPPLPSEKLQSARLAFTTMIARAKKAQPHFPPKTSQHTLLQNRIKALRIAKALTNAALKNLNP